MFQKRVFILEIIKKKNNLLQRIAMEINNNYQSFINSIQNRRVLAEQPDHDWINISVI